MNYHKIRKMDIANGPGIRVSIFMQGCNFHCQNCFNQETWSFTEGKEFNDDVIKIILELCQNEHIKGLSILGGEPMHPKNISGTTKLAQAFKKQYPNKNLWVWTGFQYEDIQDKEVFNYIDVLIDGRYQDELHDFRLKWRGSANQRVIDINKTKKNKKITLYCS